MPDRASANVWIFKLDGTIQCCPNVPEVSLQTMRAELEERIGATQVLEMEKRKLGMTVDLCGMSTG